MRPENDSSGKMRTLHRDLLLPCGFLPGSSVSELPPAAPGRRPQTRSLKMPVGDPEDCLSEEEEEGRVPQVSIPATAKFRVEGSFPTLASPANPIVTEPVRSSAKHQLVDEDPSLGTDVGDPPLLGVEEDVVEASEEENGEYLPEGEEIISTPETPPPETGVEDREPVETFPTSSNTSQRVAKPAVAIAGYGGGDGSGVAEPVQAIRRSSRQRQSPKRLQYSTLGNPLISVIQTLFHSLADAYGEACTSPASHTVVPHVHVV